MPVSRTRLFAFLLSTLLIVTVLTVALFLKKEVSAPEQQVIVRQVELAAPPPPPPPPPVSQSSPQQSMASIDLSVDGAGPAIKFEQVQLNAEQKLEQIKPPVEDSFSSHLLDQLNVNWQAFGLSELDERPRLLTNLKVSFPKALSRKGVNVVEIELDVLIDESGQVVLRRVVRNEHPEMQQVIQDLVKKARFTAPKKDGVAVRASFTWPLEFADT